MPNCPTHAIANRSNWIYQRQSRYPGELIGYSLRGQRAILSHFALPGDRFYYFAKWAMIRQPFEYLGHLCAAINARTVFQLDEFSHETLILGQRDLLTVIKRGE